jgi:hypothetical protein
MTRSVPALIAAAALLAGCGSAAPVVVPGHSPQRALRLTGRGEGRYRGPIDGPPQPP